MAAGVIVMKGVLGAITKLVDLAAQAAPSLRNQLKILQYGFMDPRCGSCHECVDHCPSRAIKGPAFIESEPREARFDALACQEYIRVLEKREETAVCGMCTAVCPHGRKKA